MLLINAINQCGLDHCVAGCTHGPVVDRFLGNITTEVSLQLGVGIKKKHSTWQDPNAEKMDGNPPSLWRDHSLLPTEEGCCAATVLGTGVL